MRRLFVAFFVMSLSGCGCGGSFCGSIISPRCLPGLECVALRGGGCSQECTRVCAAPCTSDSTCAKGCSCLTDANGTAFCGRWSGTLPDGGSFAAFQDECF